MDNSPILNKLIETGSLYAKNLLGAIDRLPTDPKDTAYRSAIYRFNRDLPYRQTILQEVDDYVAGFRWDTVTDTETAFINSGAMEYFESCEIAPVVKWLYDNNKRPGLAVFRFNRN